MSGGLRREAPVRRQASVSRLHGCVDVFPVQGAHVLTDSATVHTLDLATMSAAAAYCTSDFTLHAICSVCTPRLAGLPHAGCGAQALVCSPGQMQGLTSRVADACLSCALGASRPDQVMACLCVREASLPAPSKCVSHT